MPLLFPPRIVARPPHSLLRLFTSLVSGASSNGAVAATNDFSLRSHNCGELRIEHVGEEVELYGWLAFKRVGSKFLVLRDAYGKVQARISPERMDALQSLLPHLNCESSLRVKGRVMDRGEGNRNKRMATGDVEVEVDELEVLGDAPAELPMQPEVQKVHASEFTRLTHRCLDLRSERMQKNLRLRSTLVHGMRRYLHERCGFVEVETPTLSQSTPGGAAEFIVPATKPLLGQFYSLPQSPQIYKQLLMCGGLDRYFQVGVRWIEPLLAFMDRSMRSPFIFQVARCYRDEHTRPDRQPEFTQIDLELSYTTQAMVLSLVEKMLVESWPELAADCPTLPFPQISYEEAMRVYGIDRPDLRQPPPGGKKGKTRRRFEFLWVTRFPLFVRNNDSGRLESAHHPFTAPLEEDRADMMECRRLGELQAQHYDLVLNGVELGGGSIRLHRVHEQRHVFDKILGYPTKPFEPFFSALAHGAPPHGGFALGLDRYAMLLASGGEWHPPNSIRDVIAFPKTAKGRCLTMGAPSGELDPQVLKRYAIQIDRATIDEWEERRRRKQRAGAETNDLDDVE